MSSVSSSQRLLVSSLLGTLVLLAGCGRSSPLPGSDGPAEHGDAWFIEIAAAAGVRFDHVSGHEEQFLLPEIMGGGAALFDMDMDGDLDLYVVQSGTLDAGASTRPANRLFRNEGRATFSDVSPESGADDDGYGMGVACGDADEDGDVDLYVTNVGPNVLLRNDGEARFADVTQTAGVGHPGWGTSAAFVDYDRDGDLDLFALNYLNWSVATEMICYSEMGTADYCSPQTYSAAASDVLYRNEGDGTFRDVTGAAGVDLPGSGLGIAVSDFDTDGWPDVFVANDGMDDRLWVNRRDGTFENAALERGCAIDAHGQAKAGMGVTVEDVDDDGDMDLMVCNLNKQTDSFFINEAGFFDDRTAAAGLASNSRPFTRFGMGWIDFDNDGHLDLYQANGRVMQQADTWSADVYAEPNLLFEGGTETAEGLVSFAEVMPRGGTGELLAATSRAAAFGDIDDDGGVDIVVVNRDGPVHVLRNLRGRRGSWVGLRVIDRRGRDALGARIVLRIGERTVTREVRVAYSYLASNDPRVHVGLGSAGMVDDVVVTWPDGARETFGERGVNATHVLVQGRGRSVPPDRVEGARQER